MGLVDTACYPNLSVALPVNSPRDVPRAHVTVNWLTPSELARVWFIVQDFVGARAR